MLSVVIIWCYMLFTMSVTGYGVMACITKKCHYVVKRIDTYLICGLVCVTVYAQFFSLFYKVGLVANIVLCTICILILCLTVLKKHKTIAEMVASIRDKMPLKRGNTFFVLFLFFLFAYGTSRGLIHYDTGLYHAQSIRWIEEYGIVRGLGNLHCRLAYNSASFALSALYSFAFLGGQSFHCTAGFLAFILAKVCTEITEAVAKRSWKTSDFARVMVLYYLVNIFDEMISPASDYYMVLLAFYIIIRWLELIERKEEVILPYALLCVLGVFLLTIKLSAALILLLTIYPAYLLIRDKKWLEIVRYLLYGAAVALPYFIRNVVISGWLVYPFSQIDLFSVAWKIPKAIADYDAKEIQVWGRGYTDVSRYDISIKEWFPGWIHTLAFSDKVFVIGAFIATAVLAAWSILMAFGICKKRLELLLLQVAVTASFLFWICTSPLMRYGCVYAYLTPIVVFGGIYSSVSNSEKKSKLECILTAFVLLFIAYKGIALGRETVAEYTAEYWVLQKDYENFPVDTYEINGYRFFYPKEGDQVGYDSFPSSPFIAEIQFLGSNIEDGFYSSQGE